MPQYLLVGPNITSDYTNNSLFEIYGDRKSKIKCEDLDFPEYSNIIINAHGGLHEQRHSLNLCDTTKYTEDSLALISKNKTYSFELFSCFGGSASTFELPKSTTLITSAPPLNKTLTIMSNTNIEALSKVSTNPFIRFVHYIFKVANILKFSIQTDLKMYRVTSDLSGLKNYSDEAIAHEHKVKLDRFIFWVDQIKDKVTLERSKQIDEFYKEFLNKDEAATELSNKYSIANYKGDILINAARYNQIDVIAKLIDSGVDLNIQNKDGDTGLLMATYDNHFEIAFKLIDEGADLNIRNIHGNIALIIASNKGHFEIAQKLIDAGADLNIRGKNGNTALLEALNKGHFEIAQKMIDAGADLNVQNEEGDTALITAACQGYVEIAQKLIDAGADLNIRNVFGKTALWLAANNNCVEIVQKLIDAGADLNIPNAYGATALLQATYKDNVEIVYKLIDAGADLTQMSEGMTVFDVAILFGQDYVTSKLLSTGIYIRSTNYYTSEEADNNEEVQSFLQDPIQYILEHNNDATKALKYIQNVKSSVDHEYFEQTYDCLQYIASAVPGSLDEYCSSSLIDENIFNWALKYTAPKQAHNIKTFLQLNVLKLGVDPEQAAQFMLRTQYKALELGFSADVALRVINENQLWYLEFDKSKTIEESLEFGLKNVPSEFSGEIEPGTELLNEMM